MKHLPSHATPLQGGLYNGQRWIRSTALQTTIRSRPHTIGATSGIRMQVLSKLYESSSGIDPGCRSWRWAAGQVIGWRLCTRTEDTSLTGLDYSAGMLARAQRRGQAAALIRGDANRLPLPDHSFDRVFCINAIHHFPDKPAFLADVRRILRPGGKMWSVGLDPHRGLDHWHVYDYFPESRAIDRQRYPSSDVLREWMAAAGFKDCTTEEVEHWRLRVPLREALAQGRLEKAATSQLSVLTNAEYEQGMRRICEDSERAQKEGHTLVLTVDLRLFGTSAAVAR